jgi:glucosyl-3-phosphoglycerate synthase
MTVIRTFDASGWDLAQALEAKGDRTVSMCIPCRDEAATVGDLVDKVHTHLVGTLVDELIVLDDRSTDGTAHVARTAGATVVPIEDVHAVHGEGRGKGNALWATLLASHGDFVVWCDGDVSSFRPDWVIRLLAPLLVDDEVALVKASYDRPTSQGGGGRTTELVARPLLSLFFPELTGLHQPLAGEYAGRRRHLESIPLVEGWGVEIAMLIDLAQRFGPRCITQVDLGTRIHRHQTLDSLAVQAAEVAATLLTRTPATAAFAEDVLALHRPGGHTVELNLDERPPVSRVRVARSEATGQLGAERR